jgi:three-Cys-motif partner protein
MRLNQRKNQQGYIKRVGIFDVFCGDGKNIIEGETILGSPIEIINAIKASRAYETKQIDFFASDNRQDAIDTLSNLLDYEILPISVNTIKKPADEQLKFVKQYLNQDCRNHVILLIDPNGPGVIPFKQLNDLSNYASRLDIIINISEIAIKRIKGCRITKNCNWWADYETFEDILWELLKGYKQGWIRDAIKGDNQKWRIMTLWTWAPPRRGWEKQGLYKVKTKQDIIDILDGRYRPNETGNPSIGPLFA